MPKQINMDRPSSDQRSWGFYVAEIVKDNYYNPLHQIIRISLKGRIFDLRINPGNENPSYVNHLVLAIVPDYTLNYYYVPTERLGLAPGTLNSAGNLATIPQGICFLLDKRQRLNTTAPQNGSAGFSVSSTNMFDPKKVVTAISPPMLDRDYTSVNDTGQDLNYGSIGLFINRDGCILLKSTGASITMGKEGIHIGGRLFHESSSVETGPLSDNTISDLVGSTIPTAAAAWPKMPNFGQFANYANTGRTFIAVCDKVKAGFQLASALGGLM